MGVISNGLLTKVNCRKFTIDMIMVLYQVTVRKPQFGLLCVGTL